VTNLLLFGRVRELAAVAGALVALSSAGCYKPHVKSGGFLCNAGLVPDCPEGFQCDMPSNTCIIKGAPVDAAVEHPEVKPDGAVDHAEAGPIDVASDVPPVCLKPVDGCTSDPANTKCDPLCQTGCGCHEKCSVNWKGLLTCNQQSGALARHEGQSCSPVSDSTLSQTYDCDPGLVCWNEPCGSLCARFCRSDADCPGSVCARTLAGGFKACDFPASDCNPVSALGDMKCPVTDEGCYLSATIPDRTVCDCPNLSQKNGEPCNTSRDCLPGLVCADPLGGIVLLCHPACSLTMTPSGCPGAQMCHSFKGTTKFGVCN
jgi:hypothetical protein